MSSGNRNRTFNYHKHAFTLLAPTVDGARFQLDKLFGVFSRVIQVNEMLPNFIALLVILQRESADSEADGIH